MENVTATTASDQGLSRTIAVLTISNPTAVVTEFQTVLSLPPGVMISGMWLTIGTERVPGRIFEKRSALWVYQKITEARPVPQDPAILRYVGPNRAELRVYPVEPNRSRRVEVEFLYPEGLNPDIRVGSEKIASSAGAAAPQLGISENKHFAVSLPSELASAFPTVSREPYLHFLIDASKESAFSNPELLRGALRQAASAFPSVREARLSFVNFETWDWRNGESIALDKLFQLPSDDLRPLPDFFRGGFLGFPAIKEVLWRRHLALFDAGSDALRRFPQIVLLHGSAQPLPPDETGNLAEFSRLLPDHPGYWSSRQGARPKFQALDPAVESGQAQPIRIFQIGGARFVAPAQGPVSYVSIEPFAVPPADLQAYDPAAGRFVASGRKLVQPASSAYGRAIFPWSVEFGRIFEPFLHRGGELAALLTICRETGILVPSVAYMVVENTAQWKMIERTEKKTMKGHESLELSEQNAVPEPRVLALAMMGFLLLAWNHFRKRRASV